MTKPESSNPTHSGVPRLGQHDSPTRVVTAACQKVVSLHGAVIPLPKRESAIVVQNRVVSVNVFAGLVRDHLRLPRLVIGSSVHRPNRMVKDILFNRIIEILVHKAAVATANGFPSVGIARGSIGTNGETWIAAEWDFSFPKEIVVNVVVTKVGIRGILVNCDRGLAN